MMGPVAGKPDSFNQGLRQIPNCNIYKKKVFGGHDKNTIQTFHGNTIDTAKLEAQIDFQDRKQ